LWIVGLALARLDRNDYETSQSAREVELADRVRRRASAGYAKAAAMTLAHLTRDAARVALPAGIFFLSFMQWWCVPPSWCCFSPLHIRFLHALPLRSAAE